MTMLVRVLVVLAVVAVTAAKISIDEAKVLKVLFKVFKIDADPATCATDTTGVSNYVRDFTSEYESKNYEAALGSLSKVFSGMSSSITDCGVPQISHKLDAAAIATKFAKIGMC